MKLRQFMLLQLFADDSGNGTEGESDPSGDSSNGGESDPGGKNPDNDKDDPEPEKKYTVEEVNSLIKRKKAEWEKTRQKEDDEARKLSKMNAQEKAEYKQQQLEQEIQALKDERTLSNMRDEARKQLSEKGINISDNLLAFMVSKDAKETKEAVDSFAELFNAAVNEAVKSKARQSTPREGGYIPGRKDSINLREMAKEARIIK